jgi:hypothetical protein
MPFIPEDECHNLHGVRYGAPARQGFLARKSLGKFLRIAAGLALRCL